MLPMLFHHIDTLIKRLGITRLTRYASSTLFVAGALCTLFYIATATKSYIDEAGVMHEPYVPAGIIGLALILASILLAAALSTIRWLIRWHQRRQSSKKCDTPPKC